MGRIFFNRNLSDLRMQHSKLKLLVAFILFYVLYINTNSGFYINAYSYCDKNSTNICSSIFKSQKDHIACDPTFEDKKATLKFLYPMTRKLKKLLVDEHNRLRDKIASGTEINNVTNEKYPPAEAMRELLWDNELAYTAFLHAQKCVFDHDHCRITKRFVYAGQNLSGMGMSKRITAKEVIDYSIAAWYHEKNLLPTPPGVEAAIASYPGGELTKLVGHFTELAHEEDSHVGCALAVCDNMRGKSKRSPWGYLLTCNFNGMNFKNQPIYTAGPAASKCKRWKQEKSQTYKNLCGNNGK